MSYFNIVVQTNENTVVTSYEPVKKRSEEYQSEAALEAEFIRMLTEQGYTCLPIHTEEDLIANLRFELERLNHYEFSDAEWERPAATRLQKSWSASLRMTDPGSSSPPSRSSLPSLLDRLNIPDEMELDAEKIHYSK